MRPARMQLKEYFVAESFFRTQTEYLTVADQEDFKLNSSDLEIKVALGQHSENANEKICELTIALENKNEEKTPYVFKIVMLGFFDLHESCQAEEAELLLKTNAPSVLYSAAREFLLLTTGRGMFSPLMLPTVTFLPVEQDPTVKNIDLEKSKTRNRKKIDKSVTRVVAKKNKDKTR